MKQITQIGATVNEAVSLALQKLGKTRDQVDVEVLQEGKKGFLGFGARAAEVRVTVKEEVRAVIEEEEYQPVQREDNEPVLNCEDKLLMLNKKNQFKS